MFRHICPGLSGFGVSLPTVECSAPSSVWLANVHSVVCVRRGAFGLPVVLPWLLHSWSMLSAGSKQVPPHLNLEGFILVLLKASSLTFLMEAVIQFHETLLKASLFGTLIFFSACATLLLLFAVNDPASLNCLCPCWEPAVCVPACMCALAHVCMYTCGLIPWALYLSL